VTPTTPSPPEGLTAATAREPNTAPAGKGHAGGPTVTVPNTWRFLVFGHERQHAGNTPYDDDPQRYYSYDNFVANSRRVAPGDLVLLCSPDACVGVARIATIEAQPGTKVFLRCPVCAQGGLKRLTGPSPGFFCQNPQQRHVFRTPVRTERPCTRFRAHFGDSFADVRGTVPLTAIRAAIVGGNLQQAMARLDPQRLQPALLAAPPAAAAVIDAVPGAGYLTAEDSEAPAGGPEDHYRPAAGAVRERAMRQVAARRGQAAFRKGLRERYGDACQVTGCAFPALLEAAHISPYRTPGDNHPENGLLLRTDIHTLFDLDLLGIEPETLTVHLHPSLAGAGYEGLAGVVLRTAPGNGPSAAALESRWGAYVTRRAIAPGATAAIEAEAVASPRPARAA
jgi:hypothetical protein